jgi:ubiquinone/menaquinone biosynthesis C-methylase UbiE
VAASRPSEKFGTDSSGRLTARTLETVKTYYDRRAQEYDDWWLGRGLYEHHVRPDWDAERARLEQAISEFQPVSTLDVACGTGFLTRHLPGDVVALDQSERMLEVARIQAPDATFVHGDALELPFPDGSFERLFTSYFYCHLEEDERRRFLAEARRVARELVVVASVRGSGDAPERWEERRLQDGSTWNVYKRVFEGPDLARELGGELVFRGKWFVIVRA